MGNGAMMKHIRSPRPPISSPRAKSAKKEVGVGAPVVGRACEPGGDVELEAGVARVQCTRCSATRALPYGTVAFVCSTCSADVRVSLSTMSTRAKADARLRLQKAEKVVRSSLDDQAASCKQLWEGLKKSLCDEDALWDKRARSAEAARARVLVRAALSSHDLAHAAETLAHWDALGLPLASEKIRAALATLRREDEIESLWRRAVHAFEAADCIDLEFWRTEATSKGISVPGVVKAAINALHGEDLALRAEREYQDKLKARVTEARMRDDVGTLKALAMEARLLGEDSSVVDASISEPKTYRRPRSASRDGAAARATEEQKEEPAACGRRAPNVSEHDEFIGLLRAKTAQAAEAEDCARSAASAAGFGFGVPLFTKAPPAPTTPPGSRASASGPPSSTKPPAAPRPRTTLRPAASPRVPGTGEEATPQRARRPSSATVPGSQPWVGPTSGESGMSSSRRPSSASPKPPVYTEPFCGLDSGSSQRPGRATSASPKPPSSAETFCAGVDNSTTQRQARPSSASVRMHSADKVAGDTSTPQRPSRPASASARSCPGASTPGGPEMPPLHRPSRPSSATAPKPPPHGDVGHAGSFATPSRPSSGIFRPSYTESPIGENAASQRPARASSKPRSFAETACGVDSGAAQRTARPSSASATRPQACAADAETGTPQRRPSSASLGGRASSSQDASAPAGSPSPWAWGSATPSSPRTAERRTSKRQTSMPPRPPTSQSPRPTTPPSSSAAPPPEPPPPRPTAQVEAALNCLGLSGKPTGEEIKKAYKQAALLWHPDRPQNHGCAEEAKLNFQKAREAFDLLQTPERRSAAAGA